MPTRHAPHPAVEKSQRPPQEERKFVLLPWGYICCIGPGKLGRLGPKSKTRRSSWLTLSLMIGKCYAFNQVSGSHSEIAYSSSMCMWCVPPEMKLSPLKLPFHAHMTLNCMDGWSSFPYALKAPWTGRGFSTGWLVNAAFLFWTNDCELELFEQSCIKMAFEATHYFNIKNALERHPSISVKTVGLS